MTTYLSRSAAVLMCMILLLLSGCVTFEKTEDGTKFFKTDADNKWEDFQTGMSAMLKNGQGKMTIEEVKKMFPTPIVERSTGESKALGWYFHKSRNSIWDFAVISTSSGMNVGYLLSIGFTEEKGVLSNFELQRVVIPSKGRTITSKPIVDEMVMIRNMQLLDSMLDRTLGKNVSEGNEKVDQTLSKNVDRANDKLNQTIDKREAGFTGKVRDAVSGVNGTSGSTGTITIQTTTPGGTSTSTVTTGQ